MLDCKPDLNYKSEQVNSTNEEVSGRYGFSSAALLEAIELVMFNDHIRFGDIIVKQISEIAMSMSPAPTVANLYVAIYEEMHVLKFIQSTVLHLRRFIDAASEYGYMTQIRRLMRGTGRIFKTA